MTPAETYNYTNFRPAAYTREARDGPAAGIDVGHLVVHHLNGEQTTIGELVDRPTVIETGSTTCPLYCGNVSSMRAVASTHGGVDFMVLYTREAHPGGRQGPHLDIDQKLTAAARLPSAAGESRTIIVDELGGPFHRILGARPNSVVVLDRRARVVATMADADPVALDTLLSGLADGHLPTVTPRFRLPPPAVTIQALARGGATAVLEFIVGLPTLAGYRLRSRVRSDA